MSDASTHQCPSQYGLDDYWLCGQTLDHPLHAHIGQCTGCQERLAEYRSLESTFCAQVLPRLHESRQHETQSSGWHWGAWLEGWRLAAVPALALIAGLTIAVVWQVPSKVGLHQGHDDYTAFKGAVGLEVYCRRHAKVFPLSPGDNLQADDMLRFVPTLPGPGYLMIVSVDGEGQVSLYHPTAGREAELVRGERRSLPGSIILDRALGVERIFALFSPKPFTLDVVEEAVVDALANVGTIEMLEELPLDVSQATLLFDKVEQAP
ncbi:hypothetical protein ACFL6C_05965 [Myxococcota bacterium]